MEENDGLTEENNWRALNNFTRISEGAENIENPKEEQSIGCLKDPRNIALKWIIKGDNTGFDWWNQDKGSVNEYYECENK